MDAPLAMPLPKLSFDCPVSLVWRVAARYAEAHRRYHDWTHVLSCFGARDMLTELRSPEVDLTILFHDAIYEPFALDNEVRSAELLVAEGRQAWIPDPVLQAAQRLVLATAHHDAGSHDDGGYDAVEACIVVDADLSILGSDAATFDLYERKVREEFAGLDSATFAAGRSQVLRSFLGRPCIYATRRGRRLWESRARENLERSLSDLARDRVIRP